MCPNFWLVLYKHLPWGLWCNYKSIIKSAWYTVCLLTYSTITDNNSAPFTSIRYFLMYRVRAPEPCSQSDRQRGGQRSKIVVEKLTLKSLHSSKVLWTTGPGCYNAGQNSACATQDHTFVNSECEEWIRATELVKSGLEQWTMNAEDWLKQNERRWKLLLVVCNHPSPIPLLHMYRPDFTIIVVTGFSRRRVQLKVLQSGHYILKLPALFTDFLPQLRNKHKHQKSQLFLFLVDIIWELIKATFTCCHFCCKLLSCTVYTHFLICSSSPW